MPEYRSSRAEAAAKLSGQAAEKFDEGTEAIRRSDQYVRATVTLATVLLLIAISQRFKTRAVRVGLLGLALLVLCAPLYHILVLPRA
jgi:hypothetical protein